MTYFVTGLASFARIVYNTCAYNNGRQVNVHTRSDEVAEDMANLLNRLEKCIQSIDRDFISHWHHSFAFCLCMGEFESDVGIRMRIHLGLKLQ